MPISLSFHGAAGTVTGSCFHDTDRARPRAGRLRHVPGLQDPEATELRAVSIRCASDRRHAADACPHRPLGLDPETHAGGVRKRIDHATQATIDLLGCMLPDSGHIQESEVESLNRRSKRRGARRSRRSTQSRMPRSRSNCWSLRHTEPGPTSRRGFARNGGTPGISSDRVRSRSRSRRRQAASPSASFSQAT